MYIHIYDCRLFHRLPTGTPPVAPPPPRFLRDTLDTADMCGKVPRRTFLTPRRSQLDTSDISGASSRGPGRATTAAGPPHAGTEGTRAAAALRDSLHVKVGGDRCGQNSGQWSIVEPCSDPVSSVLVIPGQLWSMLVVSLSSCWTVKLVCPIAGH